MHDDEYRRAKVNALILLSSEFLFVVLPLLVVFIVLWVRGRTSEILTTPEWSFAAAVLVGQTLVRVVNFSTFSFVRPRWERIVLTVAILIVLGLVPALIVLGLVLAGGAAIARLAAAQLAVAAWAVVLFFALGQPAQLAIGAPTILRRLRRVSKQSEQEDRGT